MGRFALRRWTIRLRFSVTKFWETLEPEDAKAAGERYELMKAAAKMAVTAAGELAPAGEEEGAVMTDTASRRTGDRPSPA